MEWEMWRRVLLVLIVVGMGGRHVEGSNKEVFKKLCNITRGLKGLMGKNGESEKALGEALYGETGKGHFDEHGTFTDGCGILGGPNHRSQYCSHLPGYPRGNGHGCFGNSLLGTFLCTCVPGHGREDFCGLGSNVTNQGVWTSWISSEEQKKFRAAWEEVKKRCMENNTADSSGQLGDLESAVKNIKEETKNEVIKNGQGGYYLGGPSKNRDCRGSSPQPGCVTYPDKSGSPDIPWAEKILKAINISKTQEQEKSNSLTTAGNQDQNDLSDNSADSNDDDHEDEEGEEPEENPDPHNTSKTPLSRRKRRSTTTKKSAEQHTESLNAILNKYDGTFLPQPFWLLSAVVF